MPYQHCENNVSPVVSPLNKQGEIVLTKYELHKWRQRSAQDLEAALDRSTVGKHVNDFPTRFTAIDTIFQPEARRRRVVAQTSVRPDPAPYLRNCTANRGVRVESHIFDVNYCYVVRVVLEGTRRGTQKEHSRETRRPYPSF